MKSWIRKFPALERKNPFKIVLRVGKYFLVAVPFFFLALIYLLPASFKNSEKIVLIERGYNFKKVAKILKEKNLILNSKLFIIAGKLLRVDKKIKSGEYRISSSFPPIKILLKLSRGEAVLRKLLVPEGSTIYDIAKFCEESLICSSQKEFLKKTFDKKLIKKLLGIKAPSFEGYLFPDTYFFRRGTSPEEVIETMVKKFKENFNENLKQRAGALNMTVHQVVTLASIIEKETAVPEERKIISAVFHNRLQKNMLLQADPTVIYFLKKFGGNLTKSDLRKRNPYNTYIYRGLPPGPICNPGKKSIIAALFPAKENYLYFVSKGDGTHDFSETLREHNRKVFIYQIKPYLKNSAGR